MRSSNILELLTNVLVKDSVNKKLSLKASYRVVSFENVYVVCTKVSLAAAEELTSIP